MATCFIEIKEFIAILNSKLVEGYFGTISLDRLKLVKSCLYFGTPHICFSFYIQDRGSIHYKETY